MKRPVRVLSALFGLLVLPGLTFAQDTGLTWKMAFLKSVKGKTESVPFGRPLTLA